MNEWDVRFVQGLNETAIASMAGKIDDVNAVAASGGRNNESFDEMLEGGSCDGLSDGLDARFLSVFPIATDDLGVGHSEKVEDGGLGEVKHGLELPVHAGPELGFEIGVGESVTRAFVVEFFVEGDGIRACVDGGHETLNGPASAGVNSTCSCEAVGASHPARGCLADDVAIPRRESIGVGQCLVKLGKFGVGACHRRCGVEL